MSTKNNKKKGRCWKGYKPTPGKTPYSKGSCMKESVFQAYRMLGSLISEVATGTAVKWAWNTGRKINKEGGPASKVALLKGPKAGSKQLLKSLKIAGQEAFKMVPGSKDELEEGKKGTMPKNFSVKSGDKSEAGGLTQKGVEAYRRANPGSKLKTAVTTKPSKLKKGSKSAKRRKSFCARMSGMKKRLTSAKTANDPDSRINKALRKWNC